MIYVSVELASHIISLLKRIISALSICPLLEHIENALEATDDGYLMDDYLLELERKQKLLLHFVLQEPLRLSRLIPLNTTMYLSFIKLKF